MKNLQHEFDVEIRKTFASALIKAIPYDKEGVKVSPEVLPATSFRTRSP